FGLKVTHRVSKLIKDDPVGYGVAYLYTETDGSDLTYFIIHQLETVLKAFSELQEYLKKKTEEFLEVNEYLANSKKCKTLNFVQKDVIKKGAKEPGRVFSVKEVSASYDISENTARKNLNTLVTHGILMSSKSGRSVMYIAPSNIRDRLT
ncbi:DeoR family transcriptional regulator, partial [Sansalvadorimonas verongulae]|uniref:DeoR family transcriptional regulator n=1 Tax=Sansalvadorimonas verongulae TaxID=2172824 RepID=UPI0012BD078E